MKPILRTRLRLFARISLIVVCIAWPVWLFFFDNCFTMGYYTPPMRKVSLSIVSLAVPVILWQLHSSLTKALAISIAVLTWFLIALLWLYG